MSNTSFASNFRFSKYTFWVAFLFVLSTFLRFFLLTNQSFWVDEGYTLEISDALNLQAFFSNIREIDASASFQPLHYFLVFVWRKIFGNSEISIRSLSALLGTGLSIVIYLTALRVYGRRHAIFSLLLITLSSFCIYYSQEVRNYILLMFIAALQLYFLSDVLCSPKKTSLTHKWLFWITAGIGLFGSVTYTIFLVSLSAAYLVIYKNWRQWCQWWLPMVLFSLPALSYYALLPNATQPDAVTVTRYGLPIILNIFFVTYGLLVGTTYGPSTDQLRGDTASKIAALLSYTPQLLALVVVGIALLLMLIYALSNQDYNASEKAKNYFLTFLTLSIFILSLIFAIATKINWNPRHSCYIWIPFAVLLPIILQDRKNQPCQLRILAYIAFFGLITINIYSILNYYFDSRYYRDDYRAATQYLAQNEGSRSRTVLLLGNQYLLNYYGGQKTLDANHLVRPIRVNNFNKGQYDGNLAADIHQLTDGSKSVFLGVNRDYLVQEGLISKEMDKLYQLNSKKSFNYFTIYRFDKKH
jgi:4-amino-4-deoxy-L-arabinose transferase-like glycosyltransferase